MPRHSILPVALLPALVLVVLALPAALASAQAVQVTPTPVLGGPDRDMPGGLVFFADIAYVLAGRRAEFETAPDDDDGNADPRTAFGIGLWFGGHGIGEDAPEPVNKPFGVRIGVSFGGTLGGKAVATALDGDFSEFSLELEILAPWNEYGVGPQLVLSSWDVYGPLSADAEFRGQTILSGELVRQRIETYGAGLPIPVFTGPLNLGSLPVPSFFGVVPKYTFLQVGVEAETPPIRGAVSSHVLLGGLFFDWGLTTWLRFYIQAEAGAIVGYANNAVFNVQVQITFIHVPVWWLDNHIQVIAKASFEATTTALGSRYLVDPSAPGLKGAITWVNTAFRLGIRAWF
ncbi:MAG: hypothetical protein AB7K09_12850 [Planctomycetota bacterium]